MEPVNRRRWARVQRARCSSGVSGEASRTANAKRMIALLNEAMDRSSVAHRLLPDDYRFVFKRACYLWLISPDNIDKVVQDLRQAIAKGLSFDQIKRDRDLETLREHERYKAFEDEFNRKEGIANCGE